MSLSLNSGSNIKIGLFESEDMDYILELHMNFSESMEVFKMKNENFKYEMRLTIGDHTHSLWLFYEQNS